MKRALFSMGLLGVAAALAAGCSSAPKDPTWLEDVRPILVANCIRCHSPPIIGGAPAYFRLDVYEDVDGVLGAASMAPLASTDADSEFMPPRFPLTDTQKQVLLNWNAGGAPKGSPVPGNHAPTMELTGDPIARSGSMLVPYLIDDADFDIVTGTVTAEPQGAGMPITLPRQLYVGRSYIFIPTGGGPGSVPAGTYDLTAMLDDGSTTVAVDLGTVEVQP